MGACKLIDWQISFIYEERVIGKKQMNKFCRFRTQWYSNRHFRGTYSFRGYNASAFQVSPLDLQYPLENSEGHTVVQFAGEATNPNHYSTVHGAIETGWREAQRIIDEFK